MSILRSTLLLSTFLSFSQVIRAQDPTQSVLTLFIVDTDPQSLVGSVINVDIQATRTTLFVTCPTDTADSSDCGMGTGIELTVGPNFAGGNMTMGTEISVSWGCDVDTTASTAVCTESAGGDAANFPGITTETVSSVVGLPVTVTAGLEKLTASASVPTATSNGGSTASATGGSSVASGSRSGSQTGSAAVATSSSTNGATAIRAGLMGLVGVAFVAILL